MTAKWQPEWAQALKVDYFNGVPCSDIAMKINEKFESNFTGDQIYQKAKRLGFPSRTGREPWTDERKARLVELVKDPKGLSFTQIASEINSQFGTSYTRSSCIGQSGRLGLSEKKPAASGLRHKPRAIKAQAPRKRVALNKPAAPPRPSAEIIRLRCAEVVSLNLTFAENNGCWFPEGESAAEYRFCGNPKHPGSSYCTAHFHLTLKPLQELRDPRGAYFYRGAA